MIVYFGRQHTATVRLKQILSFRCVHCSHEAQALVIGVGGGGANDHFFLNEEGAKDRALTRAEKAARKNAEVTLRLATCPRCGARDAEELLAIRARGLVVASMIAVVILAFSVWLPWLKFSSLLGLWIGVPLSVGCLWISWWESNSTWKNVNDRVAFLRENKDSGKTPQEVVQSA